MVNKIGFKRDSKTSEFTKSENSKLRRDMIASVMKEAGHTKGDILKLRGAERNCVYAHGWHNNNLGEQ